jgi:hypothetical protein
MITAHSRTLAGKVFVLAVYVLATNSPSASALPACDFLTVLNAARDQAKPPDPRIAAALDTLEGAIDDNRLANCFQRRELPISMLLAIYRERGDLYLQSDRDQRLDLAAADYAKYLDTYLDSIDQPKAAVAVSEDGLHTLRKPLPCPACEFPRMVLNAYANVNEQRATPLDTTKMCIKVAEIVPDLFDRASLQKFVRAATNENTSDPYPEAVSVLCEVLRSHRLRVDAATRTDLRHVARCAPKIK